MVGINLNVTAIKCKQTKKFSQKTNCLTKLKNETQTWST